MKKIKLHIVGIHGVPAKYGGFETLADHLCRNLKDDFDITVYCSSKKYETKSKTYHNAKLKYINLSASGLPGILYDFITFIHSLYYADVILYLSPVGSGFITILSKLTKTKVIVNHGGLNEWEREKLSSLQKRWAKFNHRIAAKFSTINIADNELYRNSLQENFKANSTIIRYGGDHVNFIKSKEFQIKYPFVKDNYAVSVSRAQVDNNLHILLEAFEDFNQFKLVLISNWDVSEYGVNLKNKYSGRENIILLDAIYNIDELDFLRSNSLVYIHTHSRCGTAPSLVEAMSLSKAVIAFDVPTNRETTHNKALYFSTSNELIELLKNTEENKLREVAQEMLSIAQKEYTWKNIAYQYKMVINYSLENSAQTDPLNSNVTDLKPTAS